MYQITIDEEILKTELEVNEAIYWRTRLTLLFPKSTFHIIRAEEKTEKNE